MNRRLIGLFLCTLGLAGTPAAADTLKQWIEDFNQPEVQLKMLNLIFPDQVGPLSSGIKESNGTYTFPKNSQFVRLGGDFISGTTAYMVVSCMLYKPRGQEAINATSYLFRNTTSRPIPLSAGYATHEQVLKLDFPKLGKAFLLLMDASSGKGGPTQWSASLLELGPSGPSDRPRTAWMSPNSLRNFQLGVDALGSEKEYLLIRAPVDSYHQKEFRYFAYRWNGSRFERDELIFDSRIKSLPEDVWKYGTGQ